MLLLPCGLAFLITLQWERRIDKDLDDGGLAGGQTFSVACTCLPAHHWLPCIARLAFPHTWLANILCHAPSLTSIHTCLQHPLMPLPPHGTIHTALWPCHTYLHCIYISLHSIMLPLPVTSLLPPLLPALHSELCHLQPLTLPLHCLAMATCRH